MERCLSSSKQALATQWASFKALTFKHPATPLTATVGSLVGLGGLHLFQSLFERVEASSMILIGSTAALATLLFAAPAAPLGVPYNTLCGHTVSISIALCFHWVQLAIGVDFGAHIIAPSVAIGAMTHLKVVNPPAAAAAFIFLTSAKAQSQPLHGAFFLVAPALVGCVWALFVQCSLAWLIPKFKSSCKSGGAPSRGASKTPKRRTVNVDIVDPAVATCIIEAVEGAAYVGDPLDFLIETLEKDRARMRKQASAVLKAMGMAGGRKQQLTGAERDNDAAMRIQRAARVLIAAKRIEGVDAATRPASSIDAVGGPALVQPDEERGGWVPWLQA